MASSKKRGKGKKNETKPEPVMATAVWSDEKWSQMDQEDIPVAEIVEPSAPSMDVMY